MLQVYVIGVGAGNPDHVTIQAIDALNRLDAVLLVEKGEEKEELATLRHEILDRFVRPERSYRTVVIDDPPRDRAARAYGNAVAAWRGERTTRYEAALASLAPNETAGFLVWGDPSLYDGTLLMLDDIARRGALALDVHVIPGITSVSALAAAHGIPLNRVGEAVHITTGRRLRDGLPDADNVVVMLDGGEAWRELPDDVDIWWGAFLATHDEVLVAGRLGDCRDEIAATRARARDVKGWMFDTYLVRPNR